MNAHEIAHLHNINRTKDYKMTHFSGEQLIGCISATIREYGYFWGGGKDLSEIENDFEVLARAIQGYATGNFFFTSHEQEDISIEDIFEMAAQKLQNNT